MVPLLCPPIRRSHRTTPAHRRIGPKLPGHVLDSRPVLRKTGCYELAISEGEKGVKLSGHSPLMRAALAHTFGTAGRTKEALQIRDDLTKLATEKYVAPYFLAGIHVGMGEYDRAIEYLEKSYEEHSHWLIYLHIDPSMDELRDNPRFQDLLRRVGLPAAPNIHQRSVQTTGSRIPN